jgi:subtilisin family serine protease
LSDGVDATSGGPVRFPDMARRRPPRWVAPLAALALVSAAAATAEGAALSPALTRDLALAPGGSRLPVLVELRAQVRPERYAGRPAALLRALRRVSARSQRPLRASLPAPARSFWLVNALALDATPRQVRRMAGLPAVARVDLDRRSAVIRADAATQAWSGGSWGVSAVGAPQVWSQNGVTGAGVRLGNIDTGVDASAADLAGRIAAWRDFVSGQPTPYDDDGHGTHTIGTMVGGSASGAPIGVAPGATVLVAKAFDGHGDGSSSAILAAGQWLSDPDGNPATADQPTAINDSWGGDAPNQPWFRQMVRRWIALGIVPVFSAGNAGPNAGTIYSPADYPESIAVGAVDQGGQVPSFSSVGPAVWTNPDGTGPASGTILQKPDLAAPGVKVTSTVGGTSYQSMSGTSMAAPHVTGVVALMRQANPALSVAQVGSLLRSSAQDLGAPGPDTSSGYGMVSAPAAVAAALGAAAPTALPQIGPPSAPAAPVAAPVVAPPAPVVAPAPLRALAALRAASRVSRRGPGLVVRVVLTRRARVVASLRPANASAPRAGAARTGAGSLLLVVPVRRLGLGPHRLRVVAQDAAGRALEPALSRSVRVTR